MQPTEASPATIDAYIAGHPAHVRELLEQLRAIVKAAAPGAKEAIKYQMPTFVLNGNLVHFSAYQKHLGFYPAPRDEEEFREELAAYPGEKSSLRLPLDQPLPADLIRRIVKFRLGKIQARSARQR